MGFGMKYAQEINGTPVEIPAGWPFATATVRVETDDDAEAFAMPIGAVADCEVSHAGNALELLGEEGRARFGILAIVEPEAPPPGQVIVSTALELVDGAVHRVAVYGPAPTPPVPTRIHKVWATMVLEAWGAMDSVEDALDAAWAAGNRSFKRYWNAVGDINRGDPILGAFAATFGWSSEQLDQIFVQGAAYEAASQALGASG